MKVIGLTGGIASGKSAVSSYLRHLGADIIDADLIAREVVAPNQPAWQKIVQAFGQEILQEDGSINRKKLGDKVFNDPASRNLLNEITHPRVTEAIISTLARIKEQGPPNQVVVIDAPLLFEVGLDKLVEQVWVVYVKPEVQLERLMKRDNISEEQALARIRSQMPLAEKVERADRIIDNNGSIADTKAQVDRLMLDL